MAQTVSQTTIERAEQIIAALERIENPNGQVAIVQIQRAMRKSDIATRKQIRGASALLEWAS